MSTDYLIKVISVFIIAAWVAPAHAYLDPGTGSLIIQGIIGAIAAAGVTIRLYWYKIKGWISGNTTEESTENDSLSD